MHRNKELYSYLLERAADLTEEWYDSLDRNDPSGVYSSTNIEQITKLKNQNYHFHLHLCEVFVKEETQFLEDFQKWIQTIAQDQQHLNTPVQYILREFFRVRAQYLDYIKEFVSIHQDEYNPEMIDSWKYIIIKAFDKVVLSFVEEHRKFADEKILAQQVLIHELSSPVITLNKDIALLPLVGNIDIGQAKFMIENTLEQCDKRGINLLVIDLSGVVLIDTNVTQQIFQLIESLRLIGVETAISGIRPEIAKTAVQLGLDFSSISIYTNLNQALTSMAAI